MKLNPKNLEDLQRIIYWASAARGDLTAVVNDNNICSKEELAARALEMIEKIDECAERILLGTNRKRAS